MGKAGLEIATDDGNSIGVWAYGAIMRSRSSSQARVDLQFANDESRTLQIYDRQTTDTLLALTPNARRRGIFARLGVDETFFGFEIGAALAIALAGIAMALGWFLKS